jgi:hypothetical protein
VKLVAAILVGCALLVVPAAGADPPMFTIKSGVPGNGSWYRSAVTIQLTTTDPWVCTPPPQTLQNIFTFNTSADILSCTMQGETWTKQYSIDTAAPTVTGETTDRAPDGNGWYTHPVTVAFDGTDGVISPSNSGIASCTTASYSGPDAGSASVSGTCTDVAGNVSAPAPFALKYDATPPSVSASPARAADANGWYNHAVGVSFGGTDATSGIGSCTATTSYAGPDSATASVPGSCVDQAGNRASAALALKYDATPPTATATPARPPDANGWYNHPVAVTFAGSDALSGIASCTKPITYSGPDNGATHVDGTCTDNAGNSTPASLPLRYDATPPRIAGVAVAVDDGTSVTLSWQQPKDTAMVAIMRAPGRGASGATPVYKGLTSKFHDAGLKIGVTYRYTLTAQDQAGNEATAHVTATVRALYAPAQGGLAKAGDRLAWVPTKGADYYNVQLFRNGKKVLSAWPITSSFHLPGSWTFAGKKVALRRGTYRWYVWPGHGARAKAKYGALVGGSTFRVR